jgi:hypothetical protein
MPEGITRKTSVPMAIKYHCGRCCGKPNSIVFNTSHLHVYPNFASWPNKNSMKGLWRTMPGDATFSATTTFGLNSEM